MPPPPEPQAGSGLPTAGGATTPRSRFETALALGAYLVLALVALRNIFAAPSSLLAHPGSLLPFVQLVHLDRWDLQMVISTMVRNAELWTSRPWDLFADVGQCFPMPAAHTLGEPMFGLGLLAAPIWALSGNPIASFNFALLLTLWIPGATMYFLARHFTASFPAAFVAGLAFAFVPARLLDPSHPYVHGDFWAPAVLLFLHRLFTHGRLRDVLGFAGFTSLAMLESIYPLLSTTIMATIYGVHLAIRNRLILLRRLPALLGAATLCGLAAWLIFSPFLATRSTWQLLSGRDSFLLEVSDFLPGAESFPGWVVVGLASVGLLDRLRRPPSNGSDDPRLPFFLGGLVVALASIHTISLPLLGLQIDSPLQFLFRIVPGIDGARALATVSIGTGIATSFLCAYGILALAGSRRDPRRAAWTTAALCSLAILAVRLLPGVATATFGRSLQLVTYDARPRAEDIALVRAAGRGPLVEFPLHLQSGTGRRTDIAETLFLTSHDPRPLGACYNSFLSPVNEQIIALSRRLPSPAASEALSALGFETLLLRKNHAATQDRERFEQAWEGNEEVRERLQFLGETGALRTYRLRGLRPIESDFDRLLPADGSRGVFLASTGGRLVFEIANGSADTFLHPNPLRPTRVVLRWVTENGATTDSMEETALLPIALGPGQSLPIHLDPERLPAPGRYEVSLARAEEPTQIIGRTTVTVR